MIRAFANWLHKHFGCEHNFELAQKVNVGNEKLVLIYFCKKCGAIRKVRIP